MPLIVSDVIEISLHTTMQGRESTNVVHVRADRPITGNSQSIAERVTAAFQEHLLSILSQDVLFVSADFVDLDTEDGDTGSVGPQPSQPTAGAIASPAVPANTALLVRKATEGGRTSRNGRMFLMGGNEEAIDGAGILTGSYLALCNDAVDAFFNDVNRAANGDSGITMCVVHRPLVPTNPGTSSDVTSLSMSAVCGTQRERMRR